jgi:hypothetical protein
MGTLRSKTLFDIILNSEKFGYYTQAVLMLGYSGTQKTYSAISYSQKIKTLFKRLNFSSATTPRHF